jgi:hypothetical protein
MEEGLREGTAISGKKYIVRSVYMGVSNKSVRETLLQLAERRTIREMGL